MKYEDFRFTGKKKVKLDEMPTSAGSTARSMKEELIQRTEENLEHMARLQDRLYAQGREGLILVLQGMDCSGKDSLVRHMMSGLNPQGVKVHSFKAPGQEELSHDYLWRIGKCLPARGEIAIFNRSHYEDAVTVQVKELYKVFKMPERCLGEELVEKRLNHIRHFEEYLYDNGLPVVKIFLHLSRKEQKKRLLERLDRQEKNWKFSPDDLEARGLWHKYQAAYQRAINHTAAPCSPWYVLPADNKWFARYLASEILLNALQQIDPAYPVLEEKTAALLPLYRKQLIEE